MVRHKFRQRESWLKIDSQQSKERSQKPRKRKIKYWCHSPESDASRNPHRRKDREKKTPNSVTTLFPAHTALQFLCVYLRLIASVTTNAIHLCNGSIHGPRWKNVWTEYVYPVCECVCSILRLVCVHEHLCVCHVCPSVTSSGQGNAGSTEQGFDDLRVQPESQWRVMWTCNLPFLFYEELWIPPAEHDGIISRERQVGGQKFVAITWKE